MKDLQNYITELGLKEAVYEDAFESLDLMIFSSGMSDLILQQSPLYQYGTLVSIVNHLMALEAVIQQAAQLIGDLWETERLWGKCNVRIVEERLEVCLQP